MNDNNLPKFDSPPVIETVLSVQFSQIPNYTNAHAGWFWKKYLDDAWDQITEVPRLEDQFEKFGDDKWSQSAGKFIIQTSPGSERTQIVRSDNQRMIQIQNSRFIHNWRKVEDDSYPSYENLLPEFSDRYKDFCDFVIESKSPPLELNQWEVTYVNHIESGELWSSAENLNELFPVFNILANDLEGYTLDNFKGAWAFIIGDNLGRLHVDLKQVRLSSGMGPTGPELIRLSLTARGPIVNNDYIAGFDLGHDSIVRTFANITSNRAHTHWKRRV